MENKRKYSIIIPVSKADTYLPQCLEHCLKLSSCHYEIILLADKMRATPSPIRVIPTDSPSPSLKRNIGINNSTGEICAFLDADAYPSPDWLEKANVYFDDPEVAAVGGPNLTPSEDTEAQKASGYIMASLLGGGTPERFSPKTSHECRELQTVNMMVRKSVLNEIGGFDPSLWPGEDAKLSYQIAKTKKMIYAPEVVVYHHRRSIFRPFLKQIWSYGLTKPTALKTRRSWKYLFFLIPSLFLLGLIFGLILMFWFPAVTIPYFSILGIYLIGLLWTSQKPSKFKTKFMVFIGIFLTHITYGMGFLVGLFKRGKS